MSRVPFGTTRPSAIGVPGGDNPTSGLTGVVVGAAVFPSSPHAARTRASAAINHPNLFLRAIVSISGDNRTQDRSAGGGHRANGHRHAVDGGVAGDSSMNVPGPSTSLLTP